MDASIATSSTVVFMIHCNPTICFMIPHIASLIIQRTIYRTGKASPSLSSLAIQPFGERKGGAKGCTLQRIVTVKKCPGIQYKLRSNLYSTRQEKKGNSIEERVPIIMKGKALHPVNASQCCKG